MDLIMHMADIIEALRMWAHYVHDKTFRVP